jgi:cytoskeleton protein RodZ
MTDKDDVIVIEDKPTTHAGLSLKKAREGKQLSVSEVASELRLSRDAIENLENQQWDKLYGRAYARGYFLNYVRFLGLDEAQMIAAFDNEYLSEEPQQKLSHTVTETKQVPWLGIILIVSALLITWFAYQQWQTSKTTQQSSEQVDHQSSDSLSSEPLDRFESSVVEPIEQELSMFHGRPSTIESLLVAQPQFNISSIRDKYTTSFILGVES